MQYNPNRGAQLTVPAPASVAQDKWPSVQPMPPNSHITADALQAQADAARAAEEKAAADVEFYARNQADTALASATLDLLAGLRCARKGYVVESSATLAEHRKSLQPLAASYGYKIVLVGDKSRATLVQL